MELVRLIKTTKVASFAILFEFAAINEAIKILPLLFILISCKATCHTQHLQTWMEKIPKTYES